MRHVKKPLSPTALDKDILACKDISEVVGLILKRLHPAKEVCVRFGADRLRVVVREQRRVGKQWRKTKGTPSDSTMSWYNAICHETLHGLPKRIEGREDCALRIDVCEDNGIIVQDVVGAAKKNHMFLLGRVTQFESASAIFGTIGAMDWDASLDTGAELWKKITLNFVKWSFTHAKR